MRCETCGNTFPSKFYFATPTICNDCFGKLPPEQQAALKAAPDAPDQAGASEDCGFHAGAFFLTPLWLLFHGRVGTGLLLILLGFMLRAAGLLGVGGVLLALILQLGIAAYFGGAGYAIAWKHGGYTSTEEMKKRERPWVITGVVVGVILIPLTLISLAAAVMR